MVTPAQRKIDVCQSVAATVSIYSAIGDSAVTTEGVNRDETSLVIGRFQLGDVQLFHF